MKDTVSYVKPNLAQQHEQEGNYGMLVASVKQEGHRDVMGQQGEEAWMEEWNNRKQLDLHHRQGHGDNKTRNGSPLPPKPLLDSTTQSPYQGQPEITPELKEQTLPDASKGVKAKLRKKRGRETVFCLVSRLGGLAGLSSSPEDPLQPISLPLFGVPNLTGTAGSETGVLRSEGRGEGSTGFQLADEIDSKVTDQHQFSSSSRAPPLWTPLPKMSGSSSSPAVHTYTGNEQEAAHREELFRAIQTGPRYQTRETNCQSLVNTEDTEGSKTKSPQARAAPEMGKRVEQPHGSIKFPLWKEPSLVAQVNTNPTCQCIKGSWEQQSGAAGGLIHNQDDSTSTICGYTTEESMLEHKEDAISDGSRGIFIIDATCVIVRAEFISPPKKEHVQYPSEVQSQNPGPLNNTGIINNNPAVTSEQESDILPQDILSQKSWEETEGELGKQELQSQEPDNEENVTLLHKSPSEADVSSSISAIEAEGPSEFPNSNLLSPVIPANETLEERAVRILGIPLLGSSVEETKSKEPPPDSAVHDTGEMQQSSSDLPSMERGSEATHEGEQDEDQNYLQDSDTAEENLQLGGENTPGMEMEERCSQVEEPKSIQHTDMHESSVEDKADICTEIQGIVMQETNSEERVSFDSQVNQDASSHSKDSHGLPSLSENLCLAPSYFDSPPHTPPKSPTLMPPLSFSLPLSGSPTNDLLQVPSPLSHTASCCSLSRSASCTCSSSRPHSPLCTVCSSSHPQDSNSLTHFPSPPLSPFVPHCTSSSSLPLDVFSNSEHQSLETPVKTLLPPQSLSPIQREEPQYPKSLWDAVYRIRRHTAPDSENEEEEGGELWDNPENVGEDGEVKEAPIDLVCKREIDRSTVLMAPQSQEVLEEDSTDNSIDQSEEITALEGRGNTVMPDTKLLGERVGLQEERQGEEEIGGQVDDDTLSCSSSDSHTSRDTVIMGREKEGEERTGEDIGEGVKDNEMRVEIETKQTNQISLSCENKMCGSSEELPEAEETESYGKTSALIELGHAKECFGDADETALVGETDNTPTVETDLGRGEDGELVSVVSGEGEMEDLVCLGAMAHSNVKEGKQKRVTVEIVRSVECCSDTNQTKGNRDIGLMAENKDVNKDARYEKIDMERNTCSTPEGGGADMEEDIADCSCHTIGCHDAKGAMLNRDSAPEPETGLACDLFVTGVAQQGKEPAEITDQQEADIWPPEEEGNRSTQDTVQDLQEADSIHFEEK
ncbi:hypothetical protein ANANG_G00252980 [Anguilla anguilla]|uniref:Uncharacterized protein n=1 Tax=Anguilla anguilla TaxID=7936 RepID=A0A9D3LTR1_ANGAN|nr:hypothetical protein ANANG_G00252980 [Anguilla anguilla]